MQGVLLHKKRSLSRPFKACSGNCRRGKRMVTTEQDYDHMNIDMLMVISLSLCNYDDYYYYMTIAETSRDVNTDCLFHFKVMAPNLF